MSGAMSNHKGDIWKPNDYGYVDECKNSERVQLWEWWTQAASQAQGLQIPILHISRNNSPILTVMNMETYFQLRLEILQLQEELTKLKEG